MILGFSGLAVEDTVPILATALKDESQSVQKQAAVSLARIGPPAKSALPALHDMTDLPIVGRMATRAIAAISRSE